MYPFLKVTFQITTFLDSPLLLTDYTYLDWVGGSFLSGNGGPLRDSTVPTLEYLRKDLKEPETRNGVRRRVGDRRRLY